MRHSAALVGVLVLSVLAVITPQAGAIILLSTGDPAVNTSTPGDNSGWQYEGQFSAYLGTPIAARYFLTANHIGGKVGDIFTFHGESFTTTALYTDPGGTDLKIWQVDHDFGTWAPLYTTSGETGQELRVHGRGTQRGDPVTLNGALKGWMVGAGDQVQRWGRNIVSGVTPESQHVYLYSNFDSPGVAGECHLSVGDSGGGVFIVENGLWKLAAINYAVDDVYTGMSDNTLIDDPLFDARGYYAKNNDGTFQLITGNENVPTAFYSTRVSQRLAWIQSVTGVDPAVLPTETFSSWLHGYFTPSQLADPTVTGPTADPDGDGINNLEEFAFNLDPGFAEVVVMTAGTGVRGVPLIQVEPIAATSDLRLTAEYVRRTQAGGGGLTYTVQFTNDLTAGSGGGWQTGGTEVVTSINTRWDRVKVTDTLPVGGASGATRRFARVLVTQTVANAQTQGGAKLRSSTMASATAK